MNNLLRTKWNAIKEEIENLEPLAEDSTVREMIRELKNEASVIRFAIEDQEILGLDNKSIVERMIENREGYKVL
jgi:hypothetical protein